MPSTETLVRRLRAIAVIDVAGYSRLMAQAEASTHLRVNELFRQIVDPAVEKFRGLRIERAGDGLLVLFESSTDAVRCAVAIQRATEEFEAGTASDQRLRLRIGINVGDIIIDGEEIAGDDVNIAVRLQALAEPGTVCISAAVRSQLHEELDSTFEDLGDVVLKNIGRPVHVFQVRRRDPKAILSRFIRFAHWRVLARRRRGALLAVAVVLAGVVVLVMFKTTGQPGPMPSEAPPMSVAVLPFEDGLTAAAPALKLRLATAVVRGLAGTSWLAVTAPDAVERASSAPWDLAALGRALQVRYAVRGRLNRDSGKLSADVELLDTAKGQTAWTTRVATDDRPSAAEDLALNLVVKLRVAVYDAEVRRLFAAGGVAKTPMEFKMLGDAQRAHFLTIETERKARKQYEAALALDPKFIPALISLAYSLLAEVDLDPATPAGPLMQQVDAVSKRALASEPGSAPVWQLRSEVLARQGLWDAALSASDRALAIDPGRAFGQGQRASLMVRLGRPAEALALTDRAGVLAEQRSGYVSFQRCRALMALADYRGAVQACQKSLASEEWWLQRAYLVAAYALLGDAASAAAEKAKLLQLQPELSISLVRAAVASNDKAYELQLQSHFLRGLRLAGLREGP